jgi:hypothetical protein
MMNGENLPVTDITDDIKNCVEPDESWAQLLKLENISGDLPFYHLSRCTPAVLPLPHQKAVNLIRVKD